MNAERNIIIGGGLAGLSTAHFMGAPYRLFEAEERVGGLCRTEQSKGFTFDITGHYFHISNPLVSKLA